MRSGTRFEESLWEGGRDEATAGGRVGGRAIEILERHQARPSKARERVARPTGTVHGAVTAFSSAVGDGHHLINRSTAVAIYLDLGTRHPADVTTCADVDMTSANADGRFVHKDGAAYPGQ